MQRLLLLDAETLDDVDDDDAECKGGKCVHRVVAFDEALEERALLVAFGNFYFTHGRRRIEDCDNNEDEEEEKECRIENLPNPGKNLPRVKGEEKGRYEEE